MGSVPSPQKDLPTTIRIPGHLKDSSKRILTERDRTIKAFVIACFSAFEDDPERVLKRLKAHWPEPKRPGRPRKQ